LLGTRPQFGGAKYDAKKKASAGAGTPKDGNGTASDTDDEDDEEEEEEENEGGDKSKGKLLCHPSIVANNLAYTDIVLMVPYCVHNLKVE